MKCRRSFSHDSGIMSQLISEIAIELRRYNYEYYNVIQNYLKINCNDSYRIIYRGSEGEKRIAIISFSPDYIVGKESGHEAFYRELQVWKNDNTIPIVTLER